MKRDISNTAYVGCVMFWWHARCRPAAEARRRSSHLHQTRKSFSGAGRTGIRLMYRYSPRVHACTCRALWSFLLLFASFTPFHRTSLCPSLPSGVRKLMPARYNANLQLACGSLCCRQLSRGCKTKFRCYQRRRQLWNGTRSRQSIFSFGC